MKKITFFRNHFFNIMMLIALICGIPLNIFGKSDKAIKTFELEVTIPDVIISEIYGGGGNSGATLKNDFIELYNTTDSPIDIGGWSVQYFTASGIVNANLFVIPTG